MGYSHKSLIVSLLLLIFPALCVSLSLDDIKDMFQDRSCIEGTLVTSPGGLTLDTTTGTRTPMRTNILSSWTEGIQDFAAMLPKLGMNYFQNTLPAVSNSLDQTPMSLINELAQRNHIEYKYYLIKEEGPEHQKHFTVAVKLGEEEYVASGPSIKKAQRAAATKAFTHTSYSKPSERMKSNQVASPVMNLASELGKKLFNTGHKNDMHSAQVNKEQQALYEELDRDNLDTRHMYTAEYNQMNGHNPLPNVPSNECQLGNEYGRMIDQNVGKSPVSLVHEIAAKKKINLVFELISEDGPAHAKVFGTRCSFGHLVADGTEKSKNKSKNEAAKKMLLLLRMLPDTCMDDSLQRRTRKRKNRKKKKKNPRLEKLTTGGAGFNKLSIESSMNQFQRMLQNMDSMFSSLGQSSISNVGSGSLKKLAKRSASEFIGNANHPQAIKPSTEHSSDNMKLPQLKSSQDEMEMPRAQDNIDNPFKPDILNDVGGPPGQLNDQLKVNMDWYQAIAKNFLNSDIEKAVNSLLRNTNTNNLQQQRQIPESATKSFKEELVYVLDLIDQVPDFYDFPAANGKFVSLVSVPTNRGRVCIGEGPNIDVSQEKAAAEALFDLPEQGLDNIISRKH